VTHRSLRHLCVLVALSGLLTLLVLITDADTVWLAVGPLAVGTLDVLLFSPLVRSLPRRLAHFLALHPRLLYFLSFIIALILVAFCIFAVIFLVRQAFGVDLAWAVRPLVGGAMVAAFSALFRFARRSFRHRNPSRTMRKQSAISESPRESPSDWFKHEFRDEFGILLLLDFANVDPRSSAELLWYVKLHSPGAVLSLSEHQWVVAGSDDLLDIIVEALVQRMGVSPRPGRLCGARVHYPSDGRSVDALIQVARSRLAPLTVNTRESPRAADPGK
jgi:hypothetical protein